MEKITQGHHGSLSLDMVQGNISKLKQLFPELITEDASGAKIDVDVLKELVGNQVIDGDKERYNFTWHGKAAARRLAQTPSTGTLRPCKEESKDWDTTQNLFIEGDNLEVLKLLQKSYHKKVKMIYIDPPYNTGKDFIYPDNYRDNIKNYLALTGQVNEEGHKQSANSETSGRYHTQWLNMMYPRLKVARNMLTNDGVVFISIDEIESANLRNLCDDVFGSDNYVGEIVWKNSSKNDQDYISIQHEYIFCYVRDKKNNKGEWIEKKEGLNEIYKKFNELKKEHGNNWLEIHEKAKEWYKNFPESSPIYSNKHYKWMDDNGVYFASDISGPNVGQYVYDVYHPTTKEIVKAPSRGWSCPKEKMLELIDNNLVHFGVDEKSVPCLKTYLKNTEYNSLTSILFKDGRAASKRLKTLFSEQVFTNPKDEHVIEKLIKAVGIKGDDIVLDFFAGSATAAHAVFELNKTNNYNIKFILVQLPEDLHQMEKIATGLSKKVIRNAIQYLKKKSKPENIAEISKERIMLASQSYADKEIDTGFKVFKLDSSNIKPWDADFDNLEDMIAAADDSLKKDRTADDVLYEILLKYGLDLTLPIEEHILAGKTVHNIGCGALMICLDDEITLDVVNAIGDLKKELQPEVMRVVFKDAGFADPVVKTNAIQVLKQFGIDDVKSI